MTKLKKRRNKKYDPITKFQGMTREEYILLPYAHLIPKKVEEPDEEIVDSTE